MTSVSTYVTSLVVTIYTCIQHLQLNQAKSHYIQSMNDLLPQYQAQQQKARLKQIQTYEQQIQTLLSNKRDIPVVPIPKMIYYYYYYYYY